jgi:hypothetical protein
MGVGIKSKETQEEQKQHINEMSKHDEQKEFKKNKKKIYIYIR